MSWSPKSSVFHLLLAFLLAVNLGSHILVDAGPATVSVDCTDTWTPHPGRLDLCKTRGGFTFHCTSCLRDDRRSPAAEDCSGSKGDVVDCDAGMATVVKGGENSISCKHTNANNRVINYSCKRAKKYQHCTNCSLNWWAPWNSMNLCCNRHYHSYVTFPVQINVLFTCQW